MVQPHRHTASPSLSPPVQCAPDHAPPTSRVTDGVSPLPVQGASHASPTPPPSSASLPIPSDSILANDRMCRVIPPLIFLSISRTSRNGRTARKNAPHHSPE